jgi:hypothetical protein
VFAALDGRLDTARLRKSIKNDEEARAVIEALKL